MRIAQILPRLSFRKYRMTHDGYPREFMIAADAARRLDLSADMFRRLARKGQLTTAVTTVRGGRLFRGDDVERLAEVRRRSAGSGSRDA